MEDHGIAGLLLRLESFSESVLSSCPKTFLKILFKCNPSPCCCPCFILALQKRRLFTGCIHDRPQNNTVAQRAQTYPSATLLSQRTHREQALSVIISSPEDCVIWPSALVIVFHRPTTHRLRTWKLRNNCISVVLFSNNVSLFVSFVLLGLRAWVSQGQCSPSSSKDALGNPHQMQWGLCSETYC